MGRLLESFVGRQIISQGAWTDVDLSFRHYRDKEQIEVDLVVALGTRIWGIEVEAASSKDGRGLARLADSCSSEFETAALLHACRDVLSIPTSVRLQCPPSASRNR